MFRRTKRFGRGFQNIFIKDHPDWIEHILGFICLVLLALFVITIIWMFATWPVTLWLLPVVVFGVVVRWIWNIGDEKYGEDV